MQCELYLERLTAVMRRAGAVEARRLLPLAVRLKKELAQAKADEALLEEMLGASPDRSAGDIDREPEHD
jgi:hypothetical protein